MSKLLIGSMQTIMRGLQTNSMFYSQQRLMEESNRFAINKFRRIRTSTFVGTRSLIAIGNVFTLR